MKIGYYHLSVDPNYNKSQKSILEGAGCDEIVREENVGLSGEEQYDVLYRTVERLNAGDELVISTVETLRKSVIQIAALIKKIEDRGAKLVILDTEVEGVSDRQVQALIRLYSDMEKDLIRDRTARGLKKARHEGRVGGRPRISQETIDRIQFLYDTDKYTLREIAEQCGISLGTAYKYVQLHH